MARYTVQVDDAVAQTIQAAAKRLKIPESEMVSRVLAAHHEEFRQFPDGVLREGRQKLIALLSQIPCLSKFDSSGIDFRYWWISFDVDETSPIAARVVRRLAFLLNTESAEMMLPTLFKPMPDESPDAPMQWVISSTAARLDPADVESWLRDHLPRPISDAEAWLRFGDQTETEESALQVSSERRLPDLEDCEKVGQKHKWFNVDGVRSACYHCRVVREGQLWR